MHKTAALLLFALACSTGAYAQAVTGYGSITGTVVDPYGDGIPDTTVVISNESLAIRRVLNTSDDGIFDAPALIPGKGYAFKVTRKGFTSWTAQDVEVLMGRTINYTIHLRKQDRTTSRTEVISGPAVVNDSDASTTILLTQEEIAGLPIDARQLDPLVLIAPFTNIYRPTGAIVYDGVAFISSSLTDGMETTFRFQPLIPGLTPQTTPDAVSEFTVTSGVAGAAFGHTGGGVVNMGMHTGSAGVHGAIYDYHASPSWASRPRFDSAFNPQIKDNQLGGNLAGAILPDKVFGFANVEVNDDSSNGLNRITNPLFANSTFTGVSTSACTTTAAPCAAALAFLNPQFNAVVPRSDRSQIGFARFDWARTESDRISFEANALRRKATDGLVPDAVTWNGGLLGSNGNVDQDVLFAKANYNRTVFSNLFNEAHVGWYRNRLSEETDPKLLPSTGLTALTVDGTPFGANPNLPSTISEQRRTVVDHITFTSYSHTLIGGIEYSRNEDWIYGLPAGHAIYDYTTLTNFANDFSGNTRGLKNYNDFQQGLANTVTDLHWGEIAPFFQDTWKATPFITIVAGIRWEKTHIPQPTTTNTAYYQTCCIPSRNLDFSPRVGISYMFNDRLVIRAGFGFYYEPFPPQLVSALYNGNGTTQANLWINSTQTGAPVFPAVIPTVASIPASTLNLAYAGAKFYNPFNEQLNLALEHQIARNTTVTLTGLVSRGEKLWDLLDTNLTTTPVSKSYVLLNSGGQNIGSYALNIFNGRAGVYGHIWEVQNSGSSRYTAVAAQLRQRLWHGLTVHAQAVWSHSIDDVSGPSLIPGVPASMNVADYRSDQGNSAFDERYRGVLSFVYAPMFVGQDSPLHWIVNGWQLSGIATIGSTTFTTPTVLVNGQQFAGTTMPFPTSLNGSGGWSRVPFEPVGSLPIGSMHTLDARFSRAFLINDRVKLVALIEGFNVLNSQFATSVNTLQYIATGGAIRPVANYGQPNEAFGFPFGTNARRAEFALRLEF
ncbi:MAG TPA: TonB-dependent receptor [Verrucomicrobiae bacterium]|nr:TonB-dependent receptor [Verrucomicrobiae bacterium]